jgi:cyanate permease
VTWKAAIAGAWKLRARRHIFTALFVASVCAIIKTVLSGFGPGLLTWACLSVAMFIVYICDDARLQRRNARREASRVSN